MGEVCLVPDILDQIQNNRLFDHVSREVIQSSILPYGKRKTVARGSNLFLPLDKVTDIQILLSGKIKLVYYRDNGDLDIKSLIFPPNLIGIDLICTRTQISPYQAVAAESSEIFAFPADLLLISGRIPETERTIFLSNLLQIISRVNMQNEYRLAILTRSSLRERILVYLTMQANKAQSDTFCIPFTREEMASFLCVNRSALSHELSLLKQEGILDFSKNMFTVFSHHHADYDVTVY